MGLSKKYVLLLILLICHMTVTFVSGILYSTYLIVLINNLRHFEQITTPKSLVIFIQFKNIKIM